MGEKGEGGRERMYNGGGREGARERGEQKGEGGGGRERDAS